MVETRQRRKEAKVDNGRKRKHESDPPPRKERKMSRTESEKRVDEEYDAHNISSNDASTKSKTHSRTENLSGQNSSSSSKSRAIKRKTRQKDIPSGHGSSDSSSDAPTTRKTRNGVANQSGPKTSFSSSSSSDCSLNSSHNNSHNTVPSGHGSSTSSSSTSNSSSDAPTTRKTRNGAANQSGQKSSSSSKEKASKRKTRHCRRLSESLNELDPSSSRDSEEESVVETAAFERSWDVKKGQTFAFLSFLFIQGKNEEKDTPFGIDIGFHEEFFYSESDDKFSETLAGLDAKYGMNTSNCTEICAMLQHYGLYNVVSGTPAMRSFINTWSQNVGRGAKYKYLLSLIQTDEGGNVVIPGYLPVDVAAEEACKIDWPGVDLQHVFGCRTASARVERVLSVLFNCDIYALAVISQIFNGEYVDGDQPTSQEILNTLVQRAVRRGQLSTILERDHSLNLNLLDKMAKTYKAKTGVVLVKFYEKKKKGYVDIEGMRCLPKRTAQETLDEARLIDLAAKKKDVQNKVLQEDLSSPPSYESGLQSEELVRRKKLRYFLLAANVEMPRKERSESMDERRVIYKERLDRLTKAMLHVLVPTLRDDFPMLEFNEMKESLLVRTVKLQNETIMNKGNTTLRMKNQYQQKKLEYLHWAIYHSSAQQPPFTREDLVLTFLDMIKNRPRRRGNDKKGKKSVIGSESLDQYDAAIKQIREIEQLLLGEVCPEELGPLDTNRIKSLKNTHRNENNMRAYEEFAERGEKSYYTKAMWESIVTMALNEAYPSEDDFIHNATTKFSVNTIQAFQRLVTRLKSSKLGTSTTLAMLYVQHSTYLRAEQLRLIELGDIGYVEAPELGLSATSSVAPFLISLRIDKAKNVKGSAPMRTYIARHRDVRLCPVFALARHFVEVFGLKHREFPNVSRREFFYRRPVFSDVKDPEKGLEHNFFSEKVEALHYLAGVDVGSTVTHAGRKFADHNEAPEDEVESLGCWRPSSALRSAYKKKPPFKAIRSAAGFNPNTKDLPLPRQDIPVTYRAREKRRLMLERQGVQNADRAYGLEELVYLLFPGLREAMNGLASPVWRMDNPQSEGDDRYSFIATDGLMHAFFSLGCAFLQDSASPVPSQSGELVSFRVRYKNLAVFEHPVFKNPNYLRYEREVFEYCTSSQCQTDLAFSSSGSVQTELANALELLSTQHSSQYRIVLQKENEILNALSDLQTGMSRMFERFDQRLSRVERTLRSKTLYRSGESNTPAPEDIDDLLEEADSDSAYDAYPPMANLSSSTFPVHPAALQSHQPEPSSPPVRDHFTLTKEELFELAKKIPSLVASEHGEVFQEFNTQATFNVQNEQSRSLSYSVTCSLFDIIQCLQDKQILRKALGTRFETVMKREALARRVQFWVNNHHMKTRWTLENPNLLAMAVKSSMEEMQREISLGRKDIKTTLSSNSCSVPVYGGHLRALHQRLKCSTFDLGLAVELPEELPEEILGKKRKN